MKILRAFVNAWYGDSMCVDAGRLPEYVGTIDPGTRLEHWYVLGDAGDGLWRAPESITQPEGRGWSRVLTWAEQTTVHPRGNP